MKKILKADPVIFICILVLMGIGLFTLFSLTTTQIEERAEFLQKEFYNQLIYSFIGIFLAILAFYLPFYYLRLGWILFFIFIASSLLLLYTALFGLEINGVRRWISIGSTILEDGTIVGGLTIQASEFAKVTSILITSYLLSIPVLSGNKKTLFLSKLKDYINVNKWVLLAILTNSLTFGIIVSQRSLSVAAVTALIVSVIFLAAFKNKIIVVLILTTFFISVLISQNVFFNLDIFTRLILFCVPLGIYVFAVYSSKVNEFSIFFTIVLGIITGSVIIGFTWDVVLKDYQRKRIESFMNVNSDKQDEGFQQEQSKISIGAGQVFGKGFRQISDSRLLLLPEPTTDFIFAIFSFKYGFIGASLLILIFLILITRLFYLADKMNDKYSSLILVGTSGMILVQMFINIGMNLGILPVGGTTLPFISAGGSSLVSMLIAIGICENVIATNRMEKSIHFGKDKIYIAGWND